MSLVQHAKTELEMAGLFDEKSNYGGHLATAVMELIEVFSKQGHSGGSAAMVIPLFSKLAAYETLEPITGNDDEWNEVSRGMYQNKRNSAVFKGEDGRAYYIEGMVKRAPNGTCWSGNFYLNKEAFENRDETKVIRSSRSYIKSFPFIPKTFYIDVEEVEVEKDSWEMYALNEEQLEKVKEYYNI